MTVRLNHQPLAQQSPQAFAEQVTEHLTSCHPAINAKQMQHAMFLKQLLEEGEIDLECFTQKIGNLFPERMATMPSSIQPYIDHLAGLN